MSLIAEFRISSPALVLSTALAAAPAITIEVETEMATASNRPILVFWTTGDGTAGFECGLNDDPTAHEWTMLDEVPPRRLYRVELDTTDAQPVFPAYHRVGSVPLAATATHRGWDGRVRFPDRESLIEFRSFCDGADVDFRLRRLYASRDEGEPDGRLTAEQRSILETAVAEGYFEIPRGVSLAELGERHGITAQSASERLRRAQRRLADAALADRL